MFDRKIAPARLPDLTELQALKIALAEKQAQLTAALEAARMATWRCDLHTGRTTTSESMGPIWGLLPEQTFEADAQTHQLLHPDDREPHREVVRNAL
ncbi:MAG: hypothetical protein JO042_09815, partial [Sinobacteraceae bacterium]|nr:hypothetical protein [Nevskiaceae bacterium]